ncbi:Zn(2)-C6 fungal-specific transcription factor [Phycomyces blakesleeanus]
MSNSVASTTRVQDINFSNFLAYDASDTTSKRKKLAEQNCCFHCQKAQLSCDGSRPCKRCIKRDLANTCTDLLKKKPKYTQDTKESTLSNYPFPNAVTEALQSIDSHFIDASQLFNFSLADIEFGSETAGLEYGFIGNMLQTPLDGALMGHTTPLPSPTTSSVNHPLTPFQPSPNDEQNRSSTIFDPNPTQLTYFPFATPPTPISFAHSSLLGNPSRMTTASPVNTVNSGQQSPSVSRPLKTKRDSSTSSVTSGRRKGNSGDTPEAVYSSVRRPFNYAEGFHYLIAYVKEKMAREDLMRISRSLAMFRPSFLALIMNLTEEDLVFMEKCIQRTLLEYEKLISFSGTPTIVWRRTGEICLVGKEFSLLTQWSKDILLDKKTYIYELMDNQSAVEYWEKFSTHAFDNTDKACIYSCILKTPTQKPVPCTFCFTIKRDIFDLPSVIVGNFLPILS